ncbi:MAG: hypothetical protein HDT07_03090 [Bacteroidales bacterium]|nr:hypothetical protein [Bacteroidales bacterium]
MLIISFVLLLYKISKKERHSKNQGVIFRRGGERRSRRGCHLRGW